MAELLEPLRSKYFISGEINSTVDDVGRRAGAHRGSASATARSRSSTASPWTTTHWHFNVRPSNTEPLVRLNLGADSQELMEEKRDLVLGVILG